MTDQELLQAIGQVVESKMEPMRQDICALKDDVRLLKGDVQILKEDIQGLKDHVQGLHQRMDSLETKYTKLEEKVDGVRIYMDTDLHRTLNLLMEGQKAVLDRVTPPERYEALEVRTSALEMAVRQHSCQIQELMYA